MSELLSQVSNLSVQVFAVASMASVGLSYTLREILDLCGTCAGWFSRSPRTSLPSRCWRHVARGSATPA